MLTPTEIELCFALRDIGLEWQPVSGDWVINAVSREVSVMIAEAADDRIVTTRSAHNPKPRSAFVWAPLEHQVWERLSANGLEFVTLEGSDHLYKCYGWQKREDWKSAQPENVWSKGETAREALLAIMVKLLADEVEWRYK